MTTLRAFLDCKFGRDNSAKIDAINSMIVYILNERKGYEHIADLVYELRLLDKQTFKPNVKEVIIND